MLNSNLEYAQHLFANVDSEWFPQPTWEDAPIVPQEQQIAPNVKAVLSALAAGWAASSASPSGIGYQTQLSYTQAQSRIATATGFWLDYVALDFFGPLITRHPGESDLSFRKRLIINLLVDHGTRCSVYTNLLNLTGYAPSIIEPMNTGDCGGYSSVGQTYLPLPTITNPNPSATVYYPVIGYGTASGSVLGAGAYGSMQLPFQSFVTAYRPPGQGIVDVNGYSGSISGYMPLPPGPHGFVGGHFPSNYGYGQYCAFDEITGSVTDQDIYDTVARSSIAGTTCWTRITDYTSTTTPPSTGFLDVNFYLNSHVLAAQSDLLPVGAISAYISILPISLTSSMYEPTLIGNIFVNAITPVAHINVPSHAIGFVTLPLLLDGSFGIDQLHGCPNLPINLVASLYTTNFVESALTVPILIFDGVLQSLYSASANITPLQLSMYSWLWTQPSPINVITISTRFAVPSNDMLGKFILGKGSIGTPGGLLGDSFELGASKIGVNYGY
jgi:hypothetical protein